MSGIWSYKTLQKIPQQFRLTLGEGDTPIKTVDIAGQTIIVKDENANPNGSFKDRSLAYQISYHLSRGTTKFVISSSGNAAVSAAAYIGLACGELDVFISDNVNPQKLKKLNALQSSKIRIHQSKKAKSDAIQYARINNCLNLRGSQDDSAIVGFKTIAYELIKQVPEIDSIFLPCSSGTSALGIYKGFQEHKKNVKIFVCQTTKIQPIASEFDRDYIKSDKSWADAITDRVALRKTAVVNVVKLSGGGGLVVNDALLYQAKELSEAHNLYYSYNSLLAMAGLLKCKDQLLNPVILASGL